MTRLWLAMVYNGQCVGPYELTGKRGEKPIPRGTLSKVFYLGLWLLEPWSLLGPTRRGLVTKND